MHVEVEWWIECILLSQLVVVARERRLGGLLANCSAKINLRMDPNG